jgi:small-conductance mechanosensitive channel
MLTLIAQKMVALALFNIPIGRFLYQKIFYRFRAEGLPFEKSITFQVQKIVAEAARIGLVAYLFDIIEIWMVVAGFENVPDISRMFAQLMYSTWIAFWVRRYRLGSKAFDRAVKLKRNKKNMVSIIDKVSDFFIFGILAMIWIDILKIKRGAGLSSIFALSGAGTLTLTLATQDLVKKALGGLALASSDKFAIGDNIVLGDGTSGTVKKIGWLNTSIKGMCRLSELVI